jgi:hypothetical protein
MKVALLILCIGAVMFLLRVLVALVKEGLSWPKTVNTVHGAKSNSSRQRGELIQMESEEQERRPPLRAGKRMAH